MILQANSEMSVVFKRQIKQKYYSKDRNIVNEGLVNNQPKPILCSIQSTKSIVQIINQSSPM